MLDMPAGNDVSHRQDRAPLRAFGSVDEHTNYHAEDHGTRQPDVMTHYKSEANCPAPIP